MCFCSFGENMHIVTCLWASHSIISWHLQMWVHIKFYASERKILWNKKRHIGIGEKVQETSFDTGMHDSVCMCHWCTIYVNNGCVLECRDTPTSQCVTPISTYQGNSQGGGLGGQLPPLFHEYQPSSVAWNHAHAKSGRGKGGWFMRLPFRGLHRTFRGNKFCGSRVSTRKHYALALYGNT